MTYIKEIINKENIQEEQKLDLSILRKKGNCKTCSGLMLSCMNKVKKDKNWELARLFQDLYYDCLKIENIKKKMITIDILNGWKGKDLIEIYKGVTNKFLIESHQKDKETLEITTTRHEIEPEDLNRVLFFIKKWEIGEKKKCYDFATILGFPDWKSLWKERKIYFKTYYYPIKVLEKLKVIKYSGRGGVTRII